MPHDILKTYFGYDTFRPYQKEAIDHLLEKKDALVVLPTGGGKSLIYQIPAMKLPGLTLVFSPLISLMKDQVDGLNAIGIPAAFLNSSLNPDEKNKIFEKARAGQIKLLYVAPEGFFTGQFQSFLNEVELSLIAIDEAHCISEWGHDFRPEYRQLSMLKSRYPKTPIVALTATATKQVRADIIKQLERDAITPFIGSFERDNLHIYLEKRQKLLDQVLEILEKKPNQAGIIYCNSRKKVDELSQTLLKLGIKNKPYHAGMTPEQRKKNQDAFQAEKVNLIIATIAFGMGIDKSNVRYIIHTATPKSLENYYQEIGRAGRDGLPADCYLFHSGSDAMIQESFITEIEDPDFQAIARAKLQDIQSFVRSLECRHRHILNYFGEERDDWQCEGRCDICLSKNINEVDLTEDAQKILSCVYRLDFPVGAGTLAGILTGSRAQKIRKYQSVKTYGAMSNLSQDEVKSRIDQLFDHSLLKKEIVQTDLGIYPVIALAGKWKEVLLGKQTVTLKTRTVSQADEKVDYETELFDALRQWRKTVAEQRGVPPYAIFSDRTLTDIATYLPLTAEELKLIGGIGEKRLADFGETIIGFVKSYVDEKNLKSRMNELSSQRSRGRKVKKPKSLQPKACRPLSNFTSRTLDPKK